jgi:lipopolysaccharide transport system ATP-binding protein
MSNLAISVENVSKLYRLGEVSTRTFYDDLKRWWAKKRGLPDPFYSPDVTEGGNHQGEELWALKDISFTLNQGEVLGIIGSNGSGKSTLLKIISRVTAPTSGEVKMKGQVASLLEVGTGFHPELTGRENVFLNSALLGMSRGDVQKKFDEIVDFSGIEKFIDTPVKHYSSGMYVRLAFSVASYLSSDLLIIDEVLSVGDAAFQKKSLERMEAVAKSGKTVLFVSHGLSSVTRLCDRGLYLEDGKAVYSGTATDTVAQYLRKIHQIDEERIESETGKVLPTFLDLHNSDKRWEGYAEKILTWVSMHKINGEPCAEFQTGDSLIIRVGYHVSKEISAYCQINFLDYSATRVMQLHSTHSNSDTRLHLCGDGYIECVINDLRLLAGNYIIMLDIGDFSKEKPQWLDCIGDTLHIKVHLGNYLQGVGLAQSQVVFAQKSEWRLSS